MLNTAKALPRGPRIMVMPMIKTDTAHMEQFAFWSQLNAPEQEEFVHEVQYFETAQKDLGLSKIEIGQRLYNIQTLLTPYQAFNSFLQTTHLTGRTAYRYIDDYKRLLDLFKKPVLDAMITHGLHVPEATRKRPLGTYTKAYNTLLHNGHLPPEQVDETLILRYVRALEVQHEKLTLEPQAIAVVKARAESLGQKLTINRESYDFLLKEVYYKLQSALKLIPAKRKDEFIESLIGYTLTNRGVTGKRFTAQAIPFQQHRGPGRPPVFPHSQPQDEAS